jgi:hypothetical protein
MLKNIENEEDTNIYSLVFQEVFITLESCLFAGVEELESHSTFIS